MNFKEWAVAQHENTNHMYAGYLPYRFHLEMVVGVAYKFREIWSNLYYQLPFYEVAIPAAYGHDLIEDTRVTYSDIKAQINNPLAQEISNIIYALTNEKGKNRVERANDKYYEGIRNTPGAVFVKLCDRIANVKFGLLIGGSMLDQYRKENRKFLEKLGLIGENNKWTEKGKEHKQIVEYLQKLFEPDL